MDNVSRTLKISGIVLALMVTVLAAHPAAADSNTGSGPQTLRDRVAHQRKLCSDNGGSFSVNIQATQATATTTCTVSGETTTCTHGTSSSNCKTTSPAQAAAGTRPVRSVGAVATIDAEITSTDAAGSPYSEASADDGPVLTVSDSGDLATAAPATAASVSVEAEPGAAGTARAEPVVIEAIEDEDA